MDSYEESGWWAFQRRQNELPNFTLSLICGPETWKFAKNWISTFKRWNSAVNFLEPKTSSNRVVYVSMYTVKIFSKSLHIYAFCNNLSEPLH